MPPSTLVAFKDPIVVFNMLAATAVPTADASVMFNVSVVIRPVPSSVIAPVADKVT